MMHGDAGVFDRIATLYDWVRPDVDPTTVDRWLAFAERPVERLIDVGGGPGTVAGATTVQERVVVDPSPRMLARARRRGLETERGAAEDLPFEDDSVDVVLFVYSLHHVDDPHRALDEAARVLRPGGLLVVREVNSTGIVGRVLFGRSLHGDHEEAYLQPDALGGTIASHGFEPTVVDRGLRFTVVGVAG